MASDPSQSSGRVPADRGIDVQSGCKFLSQNLRREMSDSQHPRTPGVWFRLNGTANSAPGP